MEKGGGGLVGRGARAEMRGREGWRVWGNRGFRGWAQMVLGVQGAGGAVVSGSRGRWRYQARTPPSGGMCGYVLDACVW